MKGSHDTAILDRPIRPDKDQEIGKFRYTKPKISCFGQFELIDDF